MILLICNMKKHFISSVPISTHKLWKRVWNSQKNILKFDFFLCMAPENHLKVFKADSKNIRSSWFASWKSFFLSSVPNSTRKVWKCVRNSQKFILKLDFYLCSSPENHLPIFTTTSKHIWSSWSTTWKSFLYQVFQIQPANCEKVCETVNSLCWNLTFSFVERKRTI